MSVWQLQKVSIGYQKVLFPPLDMEIHPGEIILVLGENGIGKTSLFKTLYKEIPTLSGDITVGGLDWMSLPKKEIPKYMSVVLSKGFRNAILVKDALELGRFILKNWHQKLDQDDQHIIQETIELFDIQYLLEIPLTHLSDGQLQQVYMARSVIQDAPLLLWDEPEIHLDWKNQLKLLDIMKFLSEVQHKSILFSTHQFQWSQHIADKVLHLEKEQYYFGNSQDFVLPYTDMNLKYISFDPKSLQLTKRKK